MQPGDIAFKCNFATLDPFSGIVTSRRADRHFEDVGPLFCADLTGAQHPWSYCSICHCSPCSNSVAFLILMAISHVAHMFEHWSQPWSMCADSQLVPQV